MKTKTKTELLNFLMNGGSEEQKQNLIQELQDELDYVDIPYMCISRDDVVDYFGEDKAETIDLQKTAERMSDEYMEDFSRCFTENIVEK